MIVQVPVRICRVETLFFLVSAFMAALSGETSVERLQVASHSLEEGDFASAISTLRNLLKDARALDTSDICRASALFHLGWAYAALDQDREAEVAYRDSEAILNPLEEFHYPHLARVLESEAVLAAKRHRYRQARALLERAQSITERWAPDNRLRDAKLSVGLAAIDQLDGNRDRAVARYQQALHVIESALGRKSLDWKLVADDLAILLLVSGKRDEAAAYIDEALQQHESLAGLDRLVGAKLLLTRFDLYFASGRKREAETDIVEALQIFQTSLGSFNRLTAEALKRYGKLCRALGRKTEAREYENRATESLESSPSVQVEKHTISASELSKQPGR